MPTATYEERRENLLPKNVIKRFYIKHRIIAWLVTIIGAISVVSGAVTFVTGKTFPDFLSSIPFVQTVPLQLKVGDIYHFGDYDWQVLAVENDRALLMTKDIIDTLPYNTAFAEVTWETCTLREYLNGTFYESFGKDKKRILRTHNENPDNTWGRTSGEPFNTPGGNRTDDRIFLLSVADILKYFPGLNLYKDIEGDEWEYEADERLVATSNNGEYSWMLRSPGNAPDYVAYIDRYGKIRLVHGHVSIEYGVRPALWLNLK